MRAGFFIRFVAWFLDWVIAGGAAILAAFLAFRGKYASVDSFMHAVQQNARTPENVLKLLGGPFVGAALGLLLLYVILEIGFGTSPGKLLLRLRIADTAGRAADTSRLLFRSCLKYGAVLLALRAVSEHPQLLTLAAGCLAVSYVLAMCGSQQTLHDHIGGTAVFPIREIMAAPPPRRPEEEDLPLRTTPRSGRDPNELFKPRW